MILTFRYDNSLALAYEIGVRENGALRTLAVGLAERLARGETVTVEDAKEVCGSSRYSDLVTREGLDTCIFAETQP